MPTGAVEEPFLFIRNEDTITDSNANLDDWDDSLLIRAYDKAVASAKREIVTKLQKEKGLTDKEVEELCGKPVDTKKYESKTKTKKNVQKSPQKEKWKVGSKCRAVYSEDGEEYEAEIIDIINRKTCRVRYYGYENEEDVYFRDLLPSHGKQAIKYQIKMAELEEGECSEDSYDCKEEESDKKGLPRMPSRPPMFDGSVPLPPHPPMPDISAFPFSSSKNPLASAPIPPVMGGDEAQNALLISWYMCGYYTGYYQREIHNQRRSQK